MLLHLITPIPLSYTVPLPPFLPSFPQQPRNQVDLFLDNRDNGTTTRKLGTITKEGSPPSQVGDPDWPRGTFLIGRWTLRRWSHGVTTTGSWQQVGVHDQLTARHCQALNGKHRLPNLPDKAVRCPGHAHTHLTFAFCFVRCDSWLKTSVAGFICFPDKIQDSLITVTLTEIFKIYTYIYSYLWCPRLCWHQFCFVSSSLSSSAASVCSPHPSLPKFFVCHLVWTVQLKSVCQGHISPFIENFSGCFPLSYSDCNDCTLMTHNIHMSCVTTPAGDNKNAVWWWLATIIVLVGAVLLFSASDSQWACQWLCLPKGKLVRAVCDVYISWWAD